MDIRQHRHCRMRLAVQLLLMVVVGTAWNSSAQDIFDVNVDETSFEPFSPVAIGESGIQCSTRWLESAQVVNISSEYCLNSWSVHAAGLRKSSWWQ